MLEDFDKFRDVLVKVQPSVFDLVSSVNKRADETQFVGMHTCRLIRLEHMVALESIILFSILILNSLLRMLPRVFYDLYSSHSACYAWYGVLLVLNAAMIYWLDKVSTWLMFRVLHLARSTRCCE